MLPCPVTANLRSLPPRPKTAVSGLQRLGNCVFHLLPWLVIAALWVPVYWAYRVPGITVTDKMIEQSREFPADATLEELRDFRFLSLDWKNKQELIDGASDMLKGHLQTEGCSTRIAIPFSDRDFDEVAPGCDLYFAGFVVPDVWLQAYEATGRQEFLRAAENFIVSAEAYERSAVRPRGMLWNDHAVAARVTVLANFWRLYRHSPGFRPQVARQVLQMVARSEQLLAKPGQFTFATNHGIMQNLSLWHASLAFPALPRGEEYQRLARRRITDQMKFFISDEGVVLEHSAGYHLFGLELFGMAFRYLDLMHQPALPEWIEKYQRAEKFYAALRRPDGSLPTFGDTGDDALPLGPRVTTFDQDHRPQPLAYQAQWKPPSTVNVYPVSGYSIWWDGLEFWPDPRNLSQTVVAWSNFPSQSHKHADEMSVLFWAAGQTWLSNIGYWPYDDKWRGTIESWAGSNAPHLVGENPGAPRTTTLISSASSSQMNALELERTGSENYVARRQVIHCQPNLWLVLDNTSGPEARRTSTTWTSAADVTWQPGPTAESFWLESPHVPDRLNMFFLGSHGAEDRLLRGSTTPFAGWQLEHSVPVPASALVVEEPAKNSWAATVWTWEKSGAAEKIDPAPQMTHWTDATHWEMQLPGPAGGLDLLRQDDTLRLHSAHGLVAELRLMAPPNVGQAIAELRHQFVAAQSRYPVFSANLRRRKKITFLLFGILLLQEILFLVYTRLRGPRVHMLQGLSLVAWIGGGLWLVLFFF